MHAEFNDERNRDRGAGRTGEGPTAHAGLGYDRADKGVLPKSLQHLPVDVARLQTIVT
jgi:hypothetical protein